MVSSPRCVVCSFVLMCRERTLTWWLWGVYLDVCAGVIIAKLLTAFHLGVSRAEWPNQENEGAKMQALPSDEVNKVLYVFNQVL